MKQWKSFLAATCMAAVTAGSAWADGSVVIGSVGVPRHFNAAIQSGIFTFMPASSIFASPLRYSESWEPEPYLAESWETSDDGLTVTLHLKDGVKFHDGEPLTSEDVKFSIETIKANHPFKTMLAPVASVDTPDPLTVVIHLEHPHPALLLAMSPTLMPIIPEHIYGPDHGEIQQNPANLAPIGAGPFKFVEYKQGEYYKLAKNEDFFIEGKPYLDEIYVQMFPDPKSMLLALERGDVDMVPFLASPRDLKRLSGNDDLVVESDLGAAIGPINWIAYNTKKPPLDDVRVRQAINYAIDRNFIANVLLQGQAPVAPGPIVPGSPLANANVEGYDLDLDKANALLDEAGLAPGADGIRFTITGDTTAANEEMGRIVLEYMKTQLKKVGIGLELRLAPDFPTWAGRISSYDFDLTMDQVFNWGDPVIGVNRTYMTSNIRPNVIWSNTQQYSNPKVDELLEAAATEVDPAKRKALYDEFQEIVVDDSPIYFLNVIPYSTVYNKDLVGVPDGIWGAVAPMDDLRWKE
ncbi:ABC transporter substrate-binding protein [Chachezhania sediminis]|uniref:ABC transporter substrate-binding protein n=1 Tax=Chachezhania sediminis TaxID=2599291 RepID=UPI00131E155D|nr:ABC transporter substrate-binding protein [Chachezhania sediminis]